MTSTKLLIVGITCALLTLVIGLGYLLTRFEPNEQQLPYEPSLPSRTHDKSRSYMGHLIPARSILVRANTTGRVVAITARKGDRVREGDILAELDDRMARAELELARARLKSARTRYRAMDNSQVGADPEESAIRLRLAEADVLTVEAATSAAEHRLSDTKIRAPFDGTIMEVLIEKDKNVDPSDSRKAGLFELADLSEVLVQVYLDEREHSRMRLGQPALVTFPALPGTQFETQVLDIEPQINSVTGCFGIRIGTLRNDDGILLPGLRATVLLGVEGTSAINLEKQ